MSGAAARAHWCGTVRPRSAGPASPAWRPRRSPGPSACGSNSPRRGTGVQGLVERRNGYSRDLVLPGRTFVSPFDFNTQIEAWLTATANTRHLRSIGTCPAGRWAADRAVMVDRIYD